MKQIGKKGWITIAVVAVIIIVGIVKCSGGKKEEKISFDTKHPDKHYRNWNHRASYQRYRWYTGERYRESSVC